jgi:hypothetical protein
MHERTIPIFTGSFGLWPSEVAERGEGNLLRDGDEIPRIRKEEHVC